MTHFADRGPIARQTVAGLLVLVLAASPKASAAEPQSPTNAWNKLEVATLTGQRWDVPLGHAAALKGFLGLGARTLPG